MSSTLDHPTLGPLRGLSFPSNTQYRGLPYAHFNGRFKKASLYHGPISSTEEPYDATQWGPLCAQIPNGIKFDFALSGVELPHDAEYKQNEEEGLNVVITVPKKLKPGEKLPVIVWIHGGYWVVGGNSWPQYDLQNLVDLSVKQEKPVIGVAFNYRLGILGLLASKELNNTGNYGLKDQVLGFQWLQRHIEGFGGDPNDITAFGESAGAMLLSALLQLSTPLFTRALVMSGSATLRPSKGEHQQEALYNDVIQALDLKKKSSEERRNKLNELSPDDVISKLPPLVHVGPSIEPGFLDDVVTLNTIAEKTRPSWCDELVIGDCFHDASCFKTRVLNHPNNAEYFIDCIKSTLAPTTASAVIKAYDLSSPHPAGKSLVDCVELLTDLRWYLPILHTFYDDIKSSTKVSRYHFHQSNNFDSQWKGLAAHLFDITLLLQNHRHLLSDEEIMLGEDMALRFFRFAYGEGFISQNEQTVREKVVVVWGPNGQTKILGDEEYDESMRKGRGKLLRSLGWETCENLANALQFGIKK
ncbi:uncharacterized protein DFL_008023 [Arthrobotrys flagrans]|uniref:Carboxylesterase type B domain-containing protein n=1 Tax=Arthrobotrys flagrans TaxID=97331 RepID=A0A436ZMM4_ARTFL|nr:hypothetical protein DFL_008023 [Arthrobotrys flagrans]